LWEKSEAIALVLPGFTVGRQAVWQAGHPVGWQMK